MEVDIATEICRNSEITGQLMQNVSADNKLDRMPVHAMKNKPVKAKPRYSGDMATNKQWKCKYCGQAHKVRQCPAYGKTCHVCGKKNHFSSCCLQNKPVDMLTETMLTTGIIDDVTRDGKPDEWFETVCVSGQNVKIKVDSGASCNVMSKNTYQSLCSDKLLKAKTRLESYGGHKLCVVGKWCCVAEYGNKMHPLDFIIVQEVANTLLGLPSCVKMGIIQQASEISERDELIETYSDVFEGLGLLPGKHTIHLKNDVCPVIHSARKVPHRLREQLKAELDKMERDGIIQRVTAPTDWVSPLVLVMKKGGNIRICLDPSSLNEAIKREHYAIPTADEIFARLHGSAFFSTLDATSGFLQMQLDEESSYRTTFASPYGRFRY